MSIVIANCYDSHTHFLASGKSSLGLQLNFVTQESDLGLLNPEPHDYRKDWLVGFGLKNNLLNQFDLKASLDKYYPQTPIYFTFEDGHSGVLNSAGVSLLVNNNQKSNPIHFELSNECINSGHLKENLHFKFLNFLPDLSKEQYRKAVLNSQSYFHKAGFTFIRDLSMSPILWETLYELEESKHLKMKIDSYITVQSEDQVIFYLDFLTKAKKQKSQRIDMKGFKVFLDGTLGAQTAWLSEKYLKSDNSGLCLQTRPGLKSIMKSAWQNGYELAVHTIGDQAVDFAVDVAREVSAEGILGRLHLEHVQLLKIETIKKMKPLHIVCHFQPSHWLMDKKWLDQKISKEMMFNLFRWEDLRKNRIPFYFGSDSPISESSLYLTEKALQDAELNQINSKNIEWVKAHSYPYATEIKSETHYHEGLVTKVIFDTEVVYEKLN